MADVALLAALLLVGTLGLMTWLQFSNSYHAQSWMRHSHLVITDANNLVINIDKADAGRRGYLLSGRNDYLNSYDEAVGRIVSNQDQLQTLTIDNPVQQDRLRILAPLIQDKMQDLAQAVELRRHSDIAPSPRPASGDAGPQLTARIGRHLDTLIGEETRLLDLRRKASHRAVSQAMWLALSVSVIAIGLLAQSGYLMWRARQRSLLFETHRRVANTQMATAFDSINHGVGAFDADGRLVRWNMSFTTLLGVDASMMIEGTPYNAIAERATAIENDSMLETEYEIRRNPVGHLPGETVVFERRRAVDSRRFELRRTTPVDGGRVLTVTDITERVIADAMAAKSQRLLAVGQLTGGIAHDFNNLLAVIVGNLDLARPMLEPGHPVLTNIERAIWAAERGAALTVRLLAFARKQPLVPVPVIFSAMVADMTKVLRRTLSESIEIRVSSAPSLWPAMVDPAQVENVLLNLALNARDAMPDGGKLDIELANKVLDESYASTNADVVAGDYVMLAVSDNGCGMSPEVLARVFEPFFTTKEVDKGTGLGLAMVYGFAKQSGGHVKIYSEPNDGTTVRLYLPRAATDQLSPRSKPLHPSPEIPRGSATILLVEDEKGVREVVSAMLRNLGYQVLEAATGIEALEIFDSSPATINLLLTDVVLPGMRGDEVARRLNELQPDLPVLFMSGYTEKAVLRHGSFDEMTQLIAKPFQREQLARKVATVLKTADVDTAVVA